VDSAVCRALSGLPIWLTYLVRWLGCSDNLAGWLKLPFRLSVSASTTSHLRPTVIAGSPARNAQGRVAFVSNPSHLLARLSALFQRRSQTAGAL